MEPTLVALAATCALVGVVHVLLGPDHYVPFVALARARGWSLTRTLHITAACGLAHVGAAAVIGLVLTAAGRATAVGTALDAARGGAAAWMMLGFGAAYLLWGLRRALFAGAARAQVSAEAARDGAAWVLFLVFALGPCEPLIPLVVAPAARGSVVQTVVAVGGFSAATLSTMVALVAVGWLGVAARSVGKGARGWTHALAGAAVSACGLAMLVGW